MRPFYLASAALAGLLLAYGCGGSDDTSPSGSTSTASGGSAPSGSGGNGGSAGSGANGGGGGAGGNATTGGGNASGGANTGGNAATGGGNAGGSNSGGSGGGGAPPECTTQHDTCTAGKYCNAPGCGAGHCVSKPAPGMMSNAEDLVCGCDGVTYWNAHIAAENGSSVNMAGECPGGSGPSCTFESQCGPGLVCNSQVANLAACSPVAPGHCWGLPIECPIDGPKAKACTTNTCEVQCSLIASNYAWFDDGTCN
jgi:hypothetical protein